MNNISKNKSVFHHLSLWVAWVWFKQNTLGNDVDERRACLVKAIYKYLNWLTKEFSLIRIESSSISNPT